MLNRLRTVKMRTTIAASIVVAIALTLAGIGLLAILQKTMVDNIDSSLELRSRDIAALIEGDTSPASIAVEGDDDGFVQIIGGDGIVVVASENIDGEEPIVEDRFGTFDLGNSPIDDDTFRVHGRKTSNDATILVGRSLEDVERTTAVVMVSLGLGLPALVLLVAGTTWVVASRALRPVEAIRSEVADIGGSGLHRRVPEPATDDEIGRLATTMNAMLDRLESANERQQRFVSDASHELRTPLATIRHGLDLAKAEHRPDVDALIENTSEEAQRMQRLVDDLLLLARQGQSEQLPLGDDGLVDLVDLDDLALVEAHRTRKTDIEIAATTLDEARVRGDAHELSRVIGNLIDNAVRHADHRVTIAVVSDDTNTELHVDDDGPGVPPQDRMRIFERFTRADDARSRDKGGSGLGLSIVHELVSKHHGTTTVGDSPLGGARFTVTLPTASAESVYQYSS